MMRVIGCPFCLSPAPEATRADSKEPSSFRCQNASCRAVFYVIIRVPEAEGVLWVVQ